VVLALGKVRMNLWRMGLPSELDSDGSQPVDSH